MTIFHIFKCLWILPCDTTKLNAWRGVYEKLIPAQLFKKITAFYATHIHLLCSQQLATLFCPEQDKSRPQYPFYFFRIYWYFVCSLSFISQIYVEMPDILHGHTVAIKYETVWADGINTNVFRDMKTFLYVYLRQHSDTIWFTYAFLDKSDKFSRS